jgi:hypothetical protein
MVLHFIDHTSSEPDCYSKLNKKFIVLRNLKFVRVCFWGSSSVDENTGAHYLKQTHVAQSSLELEEELFLSVRELTNAS